MLFNSIQFAIFLPLVVGLYFSLPQRYRVLMLLLASCLFYMAFIPAYILILFLTIGIDYFAGIYIETLDGRVRKFLLVASIISTCSVLFVFKYFDFFLSNFTGLANMMGWHLSKPVLHIILPIGLSFHTFQSLSYVIEVYRGKQKAENDFITYATYVMFFPQLVAGPIERPQNLLHQFQVNHEFDYARVTSGLKRMAWGFFKKLVIADRLALYVNDVYGAPQNFNGLQLTIATFFFAYQIYCDFSGYSDIAIGAARILGFRLMENFNTPYYARSISEFWRRWHISLSTWFRDYLYSPIVFSPSIRKYSPEVSAGITTMAVFLVCGLWHGANWTYVAWGGLHGFYLVFGLATRDSRQRFARWTGLAGLPTLHHSLQLVCTFSLVWLGMILFRAQSLGDAGYVLTHFWRDWNFGSIKTEQFLLRQMPVAIAAILVLELVQLLNGKVRLAGLVVKAPMVPRWAFYLGCVFVVIMFGVFRNAQFIYFQF